MKTFKDVCPYCKKEICFYAPELNEICQHENKDTITVCSKCGQVFLIKFNFKISYIVKPI